MSTLDVAERPGSWTVLVALYRLVLRQQVTLGRVLGIGALGALAIALGVFAGLDDDPAQAAADAVSSYGFAVLLPLATLWLGTAAVGDLVEDRLLVYIWLKPVPRWVLPARRRAGDRDGGRAARRRARGRVGGRRRRE